MIRSTIPTVMDIKAAADRLKGKVMHTPILESTQINEQLGFRLLLKAESLQRTGSFKFRGAYNKISQIPIDKRSKGVIAYSSGNHAQGVAASAKLFGLPSTIVMPSDAPNIKIENTIGYGADVVYYDRKNDNRIEIADRISNETGGLIIPPYDDPDIITGQGTIALEVIEQIKKLGTKLDILIGPSSGGGMMSGCSLVINKHNPAVRLYCVEPEYYDDIGRSLEIGRRVRVQTKKQSICDALLVETPGELTFQILNKLNVKGLVCSEEDTLNAMLVAFKVFKIVLEPSGAISLAAALINKESMKGKTVLVICTGGNVDPTFFNNVLAQI